MERYAVTIKIDRIDIDIDDPIANLVGPSLLFKMEFNDTNTVLPIICSDVPLIDALPIYLEESIKPLWKALCEHYDG